MKYPPSELPKRDGAESPPEPSQPITEDMIRRAMYGSPGYQVARGCLIGIALIGGLLVILLAASQ